MRKPLALGLGALLLVSVSACSSGPKGDGRDCIVVSDSIMDRIADGANAAPIAPTAAAAVRSDSLTDATIVAMTFEVDGETDTGIWAIGGTMENPGMTLSIDAIAAAVTDWPNQMNGETFDITEDGAVEALTCLAAL